jgi:hypothetical protein
MGFTKDTRIGLQLKNAQSCVVTVGSKQTKEFGKRFIELVQSRNQGKPIKKLPAKVDIGGTTFNVALDRSDGEALVMLRSGK